MYQPNMPSWKGHVLPLHVNEGISEGFILIGHGHLSTGTKPHYESLATAFHSRGYTTARFEPPNLQRTDGRIEARSLSTDAEQLNAVFKALVNEFGHGVIIGYSTGAAVMHNCYANAHIGLLPVNLKEQGQAKLAQLSHNARNVLDPRTTDVERGSYEYEGKFYVYPRLFWNDWTNWCSSLPQKIMQHTTPALYISSQSDQHARPHDVEQNYVRHAGPRAKSMNIRMPHRFTPENADSIATLVSRWIEEKVVL